MSYKIISKFIKDISFEIPNAQTFIMIEKEILNYNLNFDITSKPFKEKIIEVNTVLRLVPNQQVKHKNANRNKSSNFNYLRRTY